jgi:hypothetical protein
MKPKAPATKFLPLVLCLGLLACTTTPVPDTVARPASSDGTHYRLVGGTNLLTCNTWGFETICR